MSVNVWGMNCSSGLYSEGQASDPGFASTEPKQDMSERNLSRLHLLAALMP